MIAARHPGEAEAVGGAGDRDDLVGAGVALPRLRLRRHLLHHGEADADRQRHCAAAVPFASRAREAQHERARTARAPRGLLLIELQNDIVHEDNIGTRGFRGVLAAQVQKRGVLAKVQALIAAAHAAGVPVVAISTTRASPTFRARTRSCTSAPARSRR